ncbi:MAG: excinuclease ABC subunit UvrC [bacterium]|nr:excinuclease ABC subunit UvrC [bacterium]
MDTKLKLELKKLPASPGVYFFKNNRHQIIYIGKAANLKNRISSYSQKQKYRNLKTTKLIENIANFDYITCDSELQALFLESEFIKRYKPIFNVREKDDKNFIYLRISIKDNFPIISFIRRPLDDGAKYFGPFLSTEMLKRAMKYLRRIFPYITSRNWPKISALEYQIGLSPSPDITKEQYRTSIKKLIMVLEGKRVKLINDLNREMKLVSKRQDYELAAKLRNQITALKSLSQKVIFGDKENIDLKLDQALSGLADKLGLKNIPARIEAYDISNFAGGDAVSSMVVFTHGMPDLRQYRHFRISTKGPDDFAMIRETIQRRFKKNLNWSLPNLILIDGGKGQLTSVLKVLSELGVDIPTIGLAKRNEEIIQMTPNGFKTIILPKSSATIKLLARVRDEAHRFAVVYHRSLRDKRIKTSQLEKIYGIGLVTQKKLMKKFGSIKNIKEATLNELKSTAGAKKAEIIRKYFS